MCCLVGLLLTLLTVRFRLLSVIKPSYKLNYFNSLKSRTETQLINGSRSWPIQVPHGTIALFHHTGFTRKSKQITEEETWKSEKLQWGGWCFREIFCLEQGLNPGSLFPAVSCVVSAASGIWTVFVNISVCKNIPGASFMGDNCMTWMEFPPPYDMMCCDLTSNELQQQLQSPAYEFLLWTDPDCLAWQLW